MPRVLQAVSPWLSSESIAKGANWPDDLASGLAGSGGVGIFFVTPEALKSQWLLFEAGRISGIGQQRVCIVRIGMDRIDPPLGLYQSTAPNKADMRKLVFDLNQLLPKPVSEGHLDATFDWAWPALEESLAALAKQVAATPTPTPAETTPPPVEMSEKVLGAIDRVEARLGGLEERLAHTDRAVRSALASAPIGALSSGGAGIVFASQPATVGVQRLVPASPDPASIFSSASPTLNFPADSVVGLSGIASAVTARGIGMPGTDRFVNPSGSVNLVNSLKGDSPDKKS
ncbi:MAG: hypothetical protein Tsb007_37090 [Rhizobacter sp.]